MRSAIPATRRERVANYGDSETVTGAERRSIFTMHKEQGTQLLLTVQCTSFAVPAGTPAGDFRPMVHVDWGHGASSVKTDVDVTYRQRFPMAASDVDVEGFIGSFPFPGQANPTAIPAGAVAKFRAFVSEGIDGLPIFATRHVTQIAQATGVLAVGQARLASVRVFNPAAQGGAVFFLLFDKATAPVAGDIPFDGAPVPNTNATFGGLVPIPMIQPRGFVKGISWGMSSTAFLYTASATNVFVVGELEQ